MRKLNRSRALQVSHQGQPLSKSALCWVLVWQLSTNWRKRYWEGGLERAISEKARPGQPRKLPQPTEVQINSWRSAVPDGCTCWTVSLINLRLVQLNVHIDDDLVRLAFKKVSRRAAPSSRGSKNSDV